MAENENNSAEERTEQPTAKRLKDAREKGQVPRSKELAATGVLISGAAGLLMFRDQLGQGMGSIMRNGLSVSRNDIMDPDYMVQALGNGIADALLILAPLFVLAMVGAVMTSVALGGWNMSFQVLVPKFDKLNPISGLKRIFSARGLSELGKAMIKFLLVAAVTVAMLNYEAPRFLALAHLELGEAMNEGANLVLFCFIVLCGSMALIAAVDVPFQLWQHNKQLRMTRQEMKEEFKETDGRPEVKQRIRQMQQEQASRRMMEQVPTADVVITNPTHFAVALKYDGEKMRAPVLVAKGADMVAHKIREVATAHGVPTLEAPPLARALFASTDLGREIPGALYMAVAEVLGYVYQVRRVATEGGYMPTPPNPEIDPSLDTLGKR